MSRGWHNESQRHSLASRGIKTKSYVNPLTARAPNHPKLRYPNEVLYDNNNLETIKQYARKTGDKIEWIADIDLKDDNEIIIEDGRFDGDEDESFLSWDPDDPGHSVGYIHSHPPVDFPWFSSTDFLLAIKVHDLRTNNNKQRCPWTYMGLVADGKLQFVAMKPRSGRKKQFEGLEAQYVSDLEGTHERVLQLEKDMAENGELIRFPEINL